MTDLTTRITIEQTGLVISLTAGLYKTSNPTESYNTGDLQYVVNQSIQWFLNSSIYPLNIPSDMFTITVSTNTIDCNTQYTAIITYKPTLVTYTASATPASTITISDIIYGNIIVVNNITNNILITGGLIIINICLLHPVQLIKMAYMV